MPLWLLCHRSEINRSLRGEWCTLQLRLWGSAVFFFFFCACDCVFAFVYNNLCPFLKLNPPHTHTHSASLLPSLPLINLVFCVSSSEMRCVCVCTRVCVQTRGCYLGALSGGAALTGDGLFLLQIWKWPETYAVRLIYCVAFTEMMKQSLALTI